MISRRLNPVLIALVSASLAKADLTTNLVAYWDFEGNLNNNAAASGGSAYNGTTPTTTLGNSASTTGAPRAGTGALSLDGAGDYMDVSTIVDVNLPWTASAWYRPDAAPAGTLRMMVFETSGNNSFAISFGLREAGLTTDTNHQTVVDTTPTTDLFGTTNITDEATAETWNHVALAFTPATPTTAGSVIAYVNGAVTNTLVVPAGSTLVIPNAGFHVGTYRNADDRWFDGSIDEVAIWDRTLSRNEVTEVFQRGQASLALNADLAAAGKGFVSVVSSNPVMGQTFGTGLYDLNTSVEIEGLPSTGHVFTAWNAPVDTQPALFNHTVTGSVEFTANFAQDSADPDTDGLSNYQELVVYLTNPGLDDTDGDLIHDGDEIFESLTNPNVSQLAAVNWIEANLGGGGTNPGDVVLTRNESNNTLTFKLGVGESTTLGTWSPLTPSTPGVGASITGGEIRIAAPGTADAKRFFRLGGEAP